MEVNTYVPRSKNLNFRKTASILKHRIASKTKSMLLGNTVKRQNPTKHKNGNKLDGVCKTHPNLSLMVSVCLH